MIDDGEIAAIRHAAINLAAAHGHLKKLTSELAVENILLVRQVTRIGVVITEMFEELLIDRKVAGG